METGNGSVSATAVLEMSPQARGIKARWDFQLKQMERAVRTGDTALLDRTRDILLSVAADADQAGITRLTQPPPSIVDDDVFDGIEQLVKTPARATSTNIGQPSVAVKANAGLTCHNGTVDSFRAVTSIPPSQFGKGDGGRNIDDRLRTANMALGKKKTGSESTPVQVQDGTEQPTEGSTLGPVRANDGPTNAGKLRAIAAARKAQGKEAVKASAGVPKVQKEKVVGQCLDGCGGETTAKFLPGHDAKLKSLLVKIERGDEPLEALPEVVRPYVTYKKGVMETHEIGGKAVKVQLYTLTRSPVRVPGRNEIEFVEHR